MTLHLHPAPRSLIYAGHCVDVSERRQVQVDASVPLRLRLALRRFCTAVEPVVGRLEWCGAPRPGVLLTIAVSRKGGREQGYRLSISREGITLAGGDETGCFYGLETLRQILEQVPASAVPVVEVRDYPDFGARGFMLDISRCKVPTMETLRTLVNLASRLKLNQLQLYTEHTFAFRAHRVVWEKASPITPDEVMALDEYCHERYIELVPNLNSFGHFERWLRHDAYRGLAECPNGFAHPWGGVSPWGSTLRPNGRSLSFLDGLYREFLPCFSSRLFNVGCDETWELGKGWSKKRCEREGVHRVYLGFLRKVHELANRHGRRMQFWGDIILREPAYIGELPRDCIALDWGYEHDHDFGTECGRFSRAGIPFYVCPGTSSWCSLLGRTTNAFGNLASAARNGLKHGGDGYLITDWGDGGHHQHVPVTLPGLVFGGGMGWCYAANRDSDTGSSIDRLVFNRAGCGLGATIVSLGTVHELLGGKVVNGTLLNKLLFERQVGAQTMGSTTLADLHRCDETIASLICGVGTGGVGWAQGKQVVDELRVNGEMARLGLARGIQQLGGHLCARVVRDRLERILHEHRRLWLARNRPGGLAESCRRLKAVGRYLPRAATGLKAVARNRR